MTPTEHIIHDRSKRAAHVCQDKPRARASVDHHHHNFHASAPLERPQDVRNGEANAGKKFRNSGKRKMSVTAEEAHSIMRAAITDCAWPVSAGQPQKVWLRRVARAVGMNFNRLYDIYAGETVPRWHDGETIRFIARWKDLQAATEISALQVEQARIETDVADNARIYAMAPRSADTKDRGIPGLG